MINNYYPGTPARNFIETGLSETFAVVLRRVYVWMTLGLLATAGTAAFVSVSPLFQVLAGQPLIFLVLMIAELGLVIGLSWGINRLSPATAMLLFFLYAILNGLTFSVLFVVYTLGSVAFTFLATAALFGVMSILGYTTKMDLSRVGSFLFMGLIGLLIAMLVNLFWANTVMGWIVTFEMTMLGLMGFAFIGMFVDSGFPSYTPMNYLPEISDGKIAILFSCPSADQKKFVDALKALGAESVHPAEARQL